VKAVNGFVVIHYAGPVCYSTAGFLEKNMDSLSPEAGELLASSSDAFVSNLQSNQVARNLAAATAAEASAAARGGGAGGSRRGTTSGGGLNQGGLGYKFMASLVELNSLIATTGPHYVRCLKVLQQFFPTCVLFLNVNLIRTLLFLLRTVLLLYCPQPPNSPIR
jgi:myosin heavy subunit